MLIIVIFLLESPNLVKSVCLCLILSGCSQAVKGIWLDPYLETIFNDLSLTRLSQGHRKQKYANGCHFCTLLEKAMQISFVSFFLALLIEQVGTRRLMPLGWSINSMPLISSVPWVNYTLWCIIKNFVWKFRHFILGYKKAWICIKILGANVIFLVVKKIRWIFLNQQKF